MTPQGPSEYLPECGFGPGVGSRPCMGQWAAAPLLLAQVWGARSFKQDGRFGWEASGWVEAVGGTPSVLLTLQLSVPRALLSGWV